MRKRNVGRGVAGVLMLVGAALVPATVLAGVPSIRDVLVAQKGHRATLHLDAGQELTGVVDGVDKDFVRLTELSGRDYFDAIVRIDSIDAVILRRVKP
ncbi:MAG: hypothetical protein PHP86_05800 [Nevskiales bacterium]|nr:hypothetical protein [Nevskiales bacterium]